MFYLKKKISFWFCNSLIIILQLTIMAQSSPTGTVLISPQPAYSGTIPIGSSSDREIIIYNGSIQNLNISSISITGPDANVFSIVNNPGSKTLGALEQLVLKIHFQPTATNDVLATLLIESDAGSFSDSLIGKGTSTEHGITAFERIIGTQYQDNASSFIGTADGGYLLVGNTIKQDENYTDAYIIKTDKNGKVDWTKIYGGNFDDGASGAAELSDGSFIIVGTSSSFGGGQAEVYLLKLDASGNKIWEKTIGENKDVGASHIIKTSDGGLLITGNTKDTPDNSRDALLIKIDTDGNLVWKKHYGTADGESASGITASETGGFIFTGSDAQNGGGDFNVFCVKIDADGNTIWSKTFGGSNWDGGSDVIKTSDGYVISGYTVSYGASAEDAYLLKIDFDGNEQWHKIYGSDHNDRFSSVVQMPDGGFLAAGSSVNFFSVNYTYTDAYFVRTDTNGNLIWSKLYGGDKNDNAGRIIYDGSGAYATLGNTNSYSQSGDFYFLKINQNGTLTDVKQQQQQAQQPKQFILAQNYPNPFNPSTQIQFSVPNNSKDLTHVELKVFNILGEEIAVLLNEELHAGRYTLTFDNNFHSKNELPSGIYFYKLTAGKYSETKKMILEK